MDEARLGWAVGGPGITGRIERAAEGSNRRTLTLTITLDLEPGADGAGSAEPLIVHLGSADSVGDTAVLVPDLIGATERAAHEALLAIGLVPFVEPSLETGVFESPVFTVLEQSPAAMSWALPGTTVHLIMQASEAPSIPMPPGRFIGENWLHRFEPNEPLKVELVIDPTNWL